MKTYLALRHAAPPGLMPRLFHWITKARLLTDYPHAGIVRNGRLMHTNLSKGLHAELFNARGWSLFPLAENGMVDVRFADHAGTPYDWFSLLAFVLPWRIRDRRRMYCYEWCWLAMTGDHPSCRVTPEMLLAETLRSHR